MLGLHIRQPLAKYLNLRAAKNFYYSCVYSSLTYCISAWGGAIHCVSATDDIMRLHHRIVQTLFRNFYSEANCFFKAAKLLKLPDIHKLYVAKYMYQFEIMESCGTVGDTIERVAPGHRYPTRRRKRLVPPQIRVESMRIDYKNQFISIWNNIPSEVLEASGSLKSFKRELTNYFLARY